MNKIERYRQLNRVQGRMTFFECVQVWLFGEIKIYGGAFPVFTAA